VRDNSNRDSKTCVYTHVTQHLEMKILFSLLLLTILFSCEEIKTSDRFFLLTKESQPRWVIFSERELWKPNQMEINLTEELVKKVIEEQKKVSYINPIYKNFDKYVFQLIPYIDDENRKIMYVNSLCSDYIDDSESVDNLEANVNYWDNFLFLVDDGGNCFWQVKIDIERGEYFDFSVNAN